MLTQNRCAQADELPVLVFLPTQNSTSGGSSDSDVNELAVSACTVPSISVAITVTPVANWPTV